MICRFHVNLPGCKVRASSKESFCGFHMLSFGVHGLKARERESQTFDLFDEKRSYKGLQLKRCDILWEKMKTNWNCQDASCICMRYLRSLDLKINWATILSINRLLSTSASLFSDACSKWGRMGCRNPA